MEDFSKNLVIIMLIAYAYYYYNYIGGVQSETHGNILSKKQPKTKQENTVIPRFSYLPSVSDNYTDRENMGDSVKDYLKYFKKYNKPLVKEIKYKIRVFDKIKDKINKNPDMFLVQELDNLNLVKNEILECCNSLIYSVDISNNNTEVLYNKFNVLLKETLENDYNFTKKTAREKRVRDIKNCKTDVHIYNGLISGDSEVLPSNYLV